MTQEQIAALHREAMRASMGHQFTLDRDEVLHLLDSLDHCGAHARYAGGGEAEDYTMKFDYDGVEFFRNGEAIEYEDVLNALNNKEPQ